MCMKFIVCQNFLHHNTSYPLSCIRGQPLAHHSWCPQKEIIHSFLSSIQQTAAGCWADMLNFTAEPPQRPCPTLQPSQSSAGVNLQPAQLRQTVQRSVPRLPISTSQDACTVANPPPNQQAVSQSLRPVTSLNQQSHTTTRPGAAPITSTQPRTPWQATSMSQPTPSATIPRAGPTLAEPVQAQRFVPQFMSKAQRAHLTFAQRAALAMRGTAGGVRSTATAHSTPREPTQQPQRGSSAVAPRSVPTFRPTSAQQTPSASGSGNAPRLLPQRPSFGPKRTPGTTTKSTSSQRSSTQKQATQRPASSVRAVGGEGVRLSIARNMK